MRNVRRPEWMLFASAFIAFAWFHQGGGWNQNTRFALVRALVEQGTVYIDSYLIYLRPIGVEARFDRPAIGNGEFIYDGRPYVLGWFDAAGKLQPIVAPSRPQTTVVDVTRAGSTGDVAFQGGHFHPNKAPGTSFLGVPAYFVLYHVERAMGVNVDSWRALTINAWLTSVFSVGLLSAIGVVIMFRFARRQAGDDVTAAVVALTFAFGTMYFPYATMQFEHNIIAVALLAAWYLLFLARNGDADRRKAVILAGACAGYAAITNYIMVVPLLMLGAYALDADRRARAIWFGVGAFGPFLMICAYNYACFGTPFTTNYRYENPLFLERSGAFLGVFLVPKLTVLVKLLVSPYRGLFVTSPVLLLGVAGLIWMWRNPGARRDSVLCAGIVVFLLLFNASFNAWDSGWAAVPRYLAPMLPFLVLPLAHAYQRIQRTTLVLAGLSAAVMFVITAVDAQPPVGNSGIATHPYRAQWATSPVTQYELPILFTGRAVPLLNALHKFAPAVGMEGLPLYKITGPVSANPIGIYESNFFQRYGPGSPQAEGNSFNVGEMVAPKSLLSLVPLLLLSGGLAFLMFRELRRGGNETSALS